MIIRGWCSACKRYDLYADDRGLVHCANCKARDLLPDREARKAAVDGPGLASFVRQFRKQVLRGVR